MGTPERAGTWRVWLIVGLWVILVAQFTVDAVVSSDGREPFPTITMPAFSAQAVGTDGTAQVTERTVHVVDREGNLQPVRVTALLAPLRSGPASLTLDRLLMPSAAAAPALSQTTIDWLKARTERLGVVPDPVGLRVVWQPVVLDTRTLKKTPTGAPTIREIRW